MNEKNVKRKKKAILADWDAAADFPDVFLERAYPRLKKKLN